MLEEASTMHAVQRTKKSKSSSAGLPVKILFGVTLSELGGAQRVVFDLISSLPQEQYDITLVTSPGGQLIHWIEELNKKRKRESRKDSHILYIEEILKETLGTKVSIVKGKKKGKIEIEYYSDDDLDRIINILRDNVSRETL